MDKPHSITINFKLVKFIVHPTHLTGSSGIIQQRKTGFINKANREEIAVIISLLHQHQTNIQVPKNNPEHPNRRQNLH